MQHFIFLIIFLLLGNLPLLQAQTLPELKKEYIYQEDSLRLNELMTEFGQNKILPKGFEQQALVALSHYPELKDLPIHFVFKKSKIAHTSQPNVASMLLPWKERTYTITISTQVAEHLEPGMLKNMPYNAQIGVLGHELGHTAYYADKNVLHLMGTAVKYLFKKFRVKFERDTDIATIHHHLTYQLLAWSQVAHPLLVKDGRGEDYLTPMEIKAYLEP